MFRVSCLDIWWRHDIWISKMLKPDYLKNAKSFRSEIKSIFPCFASALFQTYKTNYQKCSGHNLWIYAHMDVLLRKKAPARIFLRQIKCITYDDFSVCLLNTNSIYQGRPNTNTALCIKGKFAFSFPQSLIFGLLQWTY